MAVEPMVEEVMVEEAVAEEVAVAVEEVSEYLEALVVEDLASVADDLVASVEVDLVALVVEDLDLEDLLEVATGDHLAAMAAIEEDIDLMVV